jgi:hypothetical protein
MGSFRLIFVVATIGLILGACGPTPNQVPIHDPTSLPCGEEVPWDQAIEILNSGQVESVLQLHNLQVTFILKNGCRIRTLEPQIDDVFEEVRKCGDLCSMISLGTE